MWPTDPRTTVLRFHAVLYPVPFPAEAGPECPADEPWELMGKLSAGARQKVEAYFAANDVYVERDFDRVREAGDGGGLRLPDGGEIEFVYFNGGLVAIYVALTLLAAQELLTLMRLGDFVIADRDLMFIDGPTRFLASSQKAAAAVPKELGDAVVVTPEQFAGALYDWAWSQTHQR
jgi:hypothetical protein